MSVGAAGFSLANHRFRWNNRIELTKLSAERLVASRSYLLMPDRSEHRNLRRAETLRSQNRKGNVSIVYYFSDRGPEFDIEIEPGTQTPELRLEAEDGDFSIDRSGGLNFDGAPLLLKPVAECGGRRVGIQYRLEGRASVVIEIGPHDTRQRLLIDPVVAFATYLGGSGGEDTIFIRELGDGSVLMIGNTSSSDAPQAVELTGTAMQPPPGDPPAHPLRNCFIEKLTPGARDIEFLAYFGGQASVQCAAGDIDQNGRILIDGSAFTTGPITTPNAQYPEPPQFLGTYNLGQYFLARVSADGQKLDYSTYVNAGANGSISSLAAGNGDQVYLVLGCSGNGCEQLPPITGGYQSDGGVGVIRYDIGLRNPDRMTLFGSLQDRISGLAISPSGAVYIFGTTNSKNLPLQNPIQNQAPPVSGAQGGYIAAFSPDLHSLQFSTYLGGQNKFMSLSSLLFTPAGTLRVTGIAVEGAIPGLQALNPYGSPGDPGSPFSVEFAPGDAAFRQAFLVGAGDFEGGFSISSALQLPNGTTCVIFGENLHAVYPGSAVILPPLLPQQVLGPFLGCLNAQGSDFKLITQTGSMAVAPSQKGGVWAAGAGTIPLDLLGASLQPAGSLVLRYIDLETPQPVLANPPPLFVPVLSPFGPTNIYSTVSITGRNFAMGIYLAIGGVSLPLAVNDSETATLTITPASNLEAGTYLGQLVIPTQPQAVMSEPFPVVVTNQPPAAQPFTAVSPTGTFLISGPVYSTSQVTWQGQSIPFVQSISGPEVQLPPALLQPGTGRLALTNPKPGGGVQTQDFQVSSAGAAPIPPPQTPGLSLAADFFQVDRQREILYTINQQFSPNFTLAAYQLPGGQQITNLSIPKGTASRLLDFEISVNGAFLYLADDQLHITRYETNGFAQDFQVQIANDAPPMSDGEPAPGFAVRVFADRPDAFVVATPGGQLIIYDRDQPRPYTTTDFPSTVIPSFDPVLASSSYVYAIARPDINIGTSLLMVPCIVRYAIDALGFSPPEKFCNLGFEWGKYPEMQSYAGTLALADANGSVAVSTTPNSLGSLRLSQSLDVAKNLVATPTTLSFNFATRLSTNRITFSNLNTGDAIGNYPSQGTLGVLGPVLFLNDGTMVFQENSSTVSIVPQWQSVMQPYQ
jgi:hypothetical protein